MSVTETPVNITSFIVLQYYFKCTCRILFVTVRVTGLTKDVRPKIAFTHSHTNTNIKGMFYTPNIYKLTLLAANAVDQKKIPMKLQLIYICDVHSSQA